MPTLQIDRFDSEVPWQALTPANTPSPDIGFALDGPGPALPANGRSLRVTIAATATGHRIQRTIPAIDLAPFPEVRMWFRGERLAGGSAASAPPFFLEMRLGSAALPVGAPGNDWHRRLPIEPGARWSPVRMALDDLPVAVRGAVTQIALFVLPGAGSLTVWLDDLRAANPQMVVDADAALVAALDGGVSIGGTPVPAVLDVPGVTAPVGPFIGIVHYAMTPADTVGGQPQRSADHSVAGHRIYPAPEAWHLHYRIDCTGDSADRQATIVDFVSHTLGMRGVLDIGGVAHRIERLRDIEPCDAQAAGPLLRYRVTVARQRAGAVAVQPVGDVRFAVGLREDAA